MPYLLMVRDQAKHHPKGSTALFGNAGMSISQHPLRHALGLFRRFYPPLLQHFRRRLCFGAGERTQPCLQFRLRKGMQQHHWFLWRDSVQIVLIKLIQHPVILIFIGLRIQPFSQRFRQYPQQFIMHISKHLPVQRSVHHAEPVQQFVTGGCYRDVGFYC